MSRPMRRAIFIAGVQRSGSTLLDLLLGGHSACVGLGEIGEVLKQGPDGLEASLLKPCSCGSRMRECSFWGDLVGPLGLLEGDAAKRYRRLADAFYQRFGTESVLVDSSKYLRHLTSLAALDNLDLRVVHLIRDVRGYAVSCLAQARVGRGRGPFARLATRHVADWWRHNRWIEKRLSELDVPVHRLSYERLCTAPEEAWKGLCEELELGTESLPSLATTKSHVVRGNRMRARLDAESKIRYDDRWKKDRSWWLATRLLPGALRDNRRWVYGEQLPRSTSEG